MSKEQSAPARVIPDAPQGIVIPDALPPAVIPDALQRAALQRWSGTAPGSLDSRAIPNSRRSVSRCIASGTTSAGGISSAPAIPDAPQRIRDDDAAQAFRARIIAEAKSWLGTPYRHQASAKGAGADCLGLLRGVWRALYGAEPEAPPPYTPDWNERAFAAGAVEPLLEAARRHMREIALAERAPGDALVFRIVCDGPAKHCGLLVAKDRFIHAYAGRAVVESALSSWWTRRLAGAFAMEPRACRS